MTHEVAAHVSIMAIGIQDGVPALGQLTANMHLWRMARVIVRKYILSREVGIGIQDVKVRAALTQFAARAAPPDAIV